MCHPGLRNLHEPAGSEPLGGVTAGGHHGGTCTEESRSLGRCRVPFLGSAPLRLTRRPSHWELERDTRGQGFQNRGLTGTLVRDRLMVDRRTRNQPGVRCRAQPGALGPKQVLPRQTNRQWTTWPEA